VSVGDCWLVKYLQPIDIVINYKPLVNCLLIGRLLVFL